MYERAVSNLMKNNMLLHFAYADFEEGRMKFKKVHDIYNKLLECKDMDQTLVRRSHFGHVFRKFIRNVLLFRPTYNT